jgi:branched-chain amino acid transport system permease protein
MVLNMEPTILLLDEPTAGLTLDERKTIGRLFIDLVRREGFTLLVIEHDIDFVKEIADRVTVLYAGRIIADGSFYDITNNPLVREIYLGAKA